MLNLYYSRTKSTPMRHVWGVKCSHVTSSTNQIAAFGHMMSLTNQISKFHCACTTGSGPMRMRNQKYGGSNVVITSQLIRLFHTTAYVQPEPKCTAITAVRGVSCSLYTVCWIQLKMVCKIYMIFNQISLFYST